MASGGLSFTPYQVPNVAQIQGSQRSDLSGKKAVSFKNGSRRQKDGDLPTNLTAGMDYLRD